MTSNGAIACTIRHHIRQLARRMWSWDITNLDLRKDWEEYIHNVASGEENMRITARSGPDQRSNNNQRAHGEKGTRLDEYGGDRLQSANFSW